MWRAVTPNDTFAPTSASLRDGTQTDISFTYGGTMTARDPSIPDFSLALPPDGRQSAAALEIQRGVGRLLKSHGLASVTELPLANGRRADVVGLSEKGDLWIIEIKSSIEDFRADHKWPEYREYSDQLFFAVSPAFPVDILPEDAGLILADRYGGEIVRGAPLTPLAGARRKAMMLRFARCAAFRLLVGLDPDLPLKTDPSAL